jgi:hypothetical protein
MAAGSGRVGNGGVMGIYKMGLYKIQRLASTGLSNIL